MQVRTWSSNVKYNTGLGVENEAVGSNPGSDSSLLPVSDHCQNTDHSVTFEDCSGRYGLPLGDHLRDSAL